jgi:hypothetical protein
MPMVKRGTGDIAKFRLLISGFSKSGKTYSINSFQEEGKSLVVLMCPGESGVLTLPKDSDTFTSYYYELEEGIDTNSVDWSCDAIKTFDEAYEEVRRNKPDKLFIDGIHNLYAHDFNIISGGEYLAGIDMNINPQTGRNDPYRSARLYNQAHIKFGNRLAALYALSIPFVGVTVAESWQAARTDTERPGGIDATRYLWPDLPGEMATRVVQRFDARISARLEKRCIHGRERCSYMKSDTLHFVWQFYPRNDVMGVGIRGLQVTESMMNAPYIHQTWVALQSLLRKM